MLIGVFYGLHKHYTGMDKNGLYTSSRTLFVREGGRERGSEGAREGGMEGGRMSTSCRTSSYVIMYHCSA